MATEKEGPSRLGLSNSRIQPTLPTMARAGFTFVALLAILIAVYHEFFLKSLLHSVGILTRKKLETVGNTNCNKVETLQACESVS